MRTMRALVQSADTMPLRLPTDSATLDANSTATVVVRGAPAFFKGADWAIRRADLVTAIIIGDFELNHRLETVPQKTQETSTANRDILLEDPVQMIRTDAPGIFIAARPIRKKLFEMQFTSPKGGLPKRKPFVWIPESPREE